MVGSSGCNADLVELFVMAKQEAGLSIRNSLTAALLSCFMASSGLIRLANFGLPGFDRGAVHFGPRWAFLLILWHLHA